jgi:hypothetical protein
MPDQQTTDAAILNKTRELFLDAGRNASLLQCLDAAIAQINPSADRRRFVRALRTVARGSEGEGWQCKTLDRAIERALHDG